MITPAEVTFDLIWRHGAIDNVLGTWSQSFTPNASGFDAQPYEYDVDAPAIAYAPGDLLVFRYTASAASQPNAWIPNGDGVNANGRDPSFTLPR